MHENEKKQGCPFVLVEEMIVCRGFSLGMSGVRCAFCHPDSGICGNEDIQEMLRTNSIAHKRDTSSPMDPLQHPLILDILTNVRDKTKSDAESAKKRAERSGEKTPHPYQNDATYPYERMSELWERYAELLQKSNTWKQTESSVSDAFADSARFVLRLIDIEQDIYFKGEPPLKEPPLKEDE